MAVSNAFFFSVSYPSILIANQTETDIPDIPDGRLLQVFSSRFSGDDISAEYERSAIDAGISLM